MMAWMTRPEKVLDSMSQRFQQVSPVQSRAETVAHSTTGRIVHWTTNKLLKLVEDARYLAPSAVVLALRILR
jgi:hypothetical protein